MKTSEWSSPFRSSKIEWVVQQFDCVLLCIQDWERLHAAFLDMQTYWNMLEWKRKQLEEEENEQMVGQTVTNALPESIKYIQLDLRDLMSQVSSQVSTVFCLILFSIFTNANTLVKVIAKPVKTVLLPSADESHSELLAEEDHSHRTCNSEQRNQL